MPFFKWTYPEGTSNCARIQKLYIKVVTLYFLRLSISIILRMLFFSSAFSAMDDLIEDSPEETLSLMLTFFAKQSKSESCYIVEVSEDKVLMLCNFLREKIMYWIKLFGTAGSDNQLYKQIPESEVAILWGVICCFPYFPNLHEKFALFKELIYSFDQFLETETGRYHLSPCNVSSYV